MATFSLGMLGILLMLNICFVVNHFVIRALRRLTDTKHAAKQKLKKQHKSQWKASATQNTVPNSEISDFAFAWLLGSVRLEALSVKKFPDWKPIPYQVGIITTNLLVVLSAILLSTDIIAEQLGISTLELDADLCVTEAMDAGILHLRNELLNMTNLVEAKQQFSVLQTFHEALVNDTSLFGIPPYECPPRGPLSGLKSDWEQNHGPESFFPGYCEEALEAALEAAEHRECFHEICDCPTLPDSAAFQMIGLAERKFCGEVCIEAPYPCPPHAKTDETYEANLNDYRYRQYQAAERRQQELVQNSPFPTSIPDTLQSSASKTADKIMYQVDVASYIYIGYSCVALFFPSPLVLFRMPYWVAFKRIIFGVQKPFFICFVVALWWGFEYFQAVWYSPDLQILLANLRLRDPCFVDTDYLLQRHQTLNDVCKELMPMESQFSVSAMTVTDVLREVSFFADSCRCSLPNQHLANISSIVYESATLGFDEIMNICHNRPGSKNDVDCIIPIPGEGISFLGNSSICTDRDESRRLIMESHLDSSDKSNTSFQMDWYNLWVASGFLALLVVKVAVANFGLSLMTLADPFITCAGEFLWLPTYLGGGGGDAPFVFREEKKISRRASLGILSHKDHSLEHDILGGWFQTKQKTLFHIGLSRTIFWGFLVLLCMVNLFLTAYQEVYKEIGIETWDELGMVHIYEVLERRDMQVLSGCLACTVFSVIIGTVILWKVNQQILELASRENILDTDDSSSSDGEDSPEMVRSIPFDEEVQPTAPISCRDADMVNSATFQFDNDGQNALPLR